MLNVFYVCQSDRWDFSANLQRSVPDCSLYIFCFLRVRLSRSRLKNSIISRSHIPVRKRSSNICCFYGTFYVIFSACGYAIVDHIFARNDRLELALQTKPTRINLAPRIHIWRSASVHTGVPSLSYQLYDLHFATDTGRNLIV